MVETSIIGIDCATDNAKVGLALAVVNDAGCIISFAGACTNGRVVADELLERLAGSNRVLLALDAPLGWPRPLGSALSVHRAGESLPCAANELFRRETDRFVRSRIGKQSLDVGADRIARTAHSALRLISDLRQKTGLLIPLAWEPDYSERVAVIEVYPAATLIAHGVPTTGYKKKEAVVERKAMIRSLERLIQLPQDRTTLEQSADSLDAAVCVLAGFDFLQGDAYSPPDGEMARHEGWIWVRPRA